MMKQMEELRGEMREQERQSLILGEKVSMLEQSSSIYEK